MARKPQPLEPTAGLLQRLRQLIAAGEFPPGSRLPPTRALASRLQISRATVGELLRRLEVEGAVVAGSERIRFVAGGEPRAEERVPPLPSGTVAILTGLPVDYPAATSFPFVHRIHAALSSGLLAAGLNPFLMVGGAEQARRAAGLRPTACVILDDAFGDQPQHAAFLAPLLGQGIPLVVQSDRMSADAVAPLDRVCCDHAAGAAGLVSLLAGRGRRRLVALLPDLADDRLWIRERERGLREAAARLGLPEPVVVLLPFLPVIGNEERCFQRSVHLAAGFLYEHLRGETPADAVLVASDGEVSSAAAACRLLGHPPGEGLELVGYDDYWRGIPERRFESYRPVATVDRDGSAVGRVMAEVVAARLANHSAPFQMQLIPPRLIVGEHVGATGPTEDA